MSSISILWLGVFVVLLIVLGFLKSKFKLSFSIRVFIAMVLGMALGLKIYFSVDIDDVGHIRKWFALIGYRSVENVNITISTSEYYFGFIKIK